MIRILLLSFIPVVLSSGTWNYDMSPHSHTGPHSWGNMFQTCKGNGQSPIDIKVDDVEIDESLLPFKLVGFDKPDEFSFKLKNNGHSAQIDFVTAPDNFEVSGGGLEMTYKPAQFHFHWGSEDTRGSEHLIDGARFPMELHIVTYKATHPNISAAMKSGKSDDLAVLGFFFEVVNDANEAMYKITDHMESIEYFGQSFNLPVFAMSDIIGPAADLGPYYRYYGSLTTPPCSEIVIWTLFEKKIPIKTDQLQRFRILIDHERYIIENNYRPIQPLNSRRVLFSGSNSFTASFTSMLTMLLVTYIFRH